MLRTFRDPRERTNKAVFMEFARYESAHDTFGGFQPIRATFDGRHKLVINLMTSDELYDLQADPQEMKNLINAPEYAQIRNALHDQILDWMNRTRDPFRGYYWERRPWRTDAPPAMWDDGQKRLLANRTRENPEYEPEQLVYETGMTRSWAAQKKNSQDFSG